MNIRTQFKSSARKLKLKKDEYVMIKISYQICNKKIQIYTRDLMNTRVTQHDG